MKGIHRACRTGDLASLQAALKPDSLELKDTEQGWSPLYRCVVLGHLPAVKLLLAAGADPNFQSVQGETGLHQAADSDSEEIGRALCDYGADINVRQEEGETPLHYAAYKGSAKVARMLLERGADPNTPNSTLGWTALHYAADYNYLELARLLLAHGADDSILDVKRRKPVNLAKSQQMCSLFGSSVSRTSETPSQISALDEDFRQLKQIKYSICESLKESASFVTEAETRCPKPRNTALYTWLLSLRLEEMFDLLVDAGYDDLDFMLMQMRGETPFTLDSLARLGMEKLGWRLRFIAFLSEEAKQSANPASRLSCSKPQVSTQWLQSVPTLRGWLAALNLSSYHILFERAGLEELDQLLMLMNTAYPITDSCLKDLGVDKPGHRARILAKLQDDSLGVVYCCRLKPIGQGNCCNVMCLTC